MAVPPTVPIVDEAALFEVTMLIWPVVLMEACRSFAASAVLSSFSVEICPAPVPKVMLVAVVPLVVVGVIVSVWPWSDGGVRLVVVAATAVRPSFVSVAARPPITRGCVVPVLRTRSVPPLTVEGVVAPVMLSIAVSKSPTVAVLRSSVSPVALNVLPPPLANVIVLPSIVRLSVVAMAEVNAVSLAVVAVAPATAVPVTVLLAGGPSRLFAVAPGMAAEVTLDLVR